MKHNDTQFFFLLLGTAPWSRKKAYGACVEWQPAAVIIIIIIIRRCTRLYEWCTEATYPPLGPALSDCFNLLSLVPLHISSYWATVREMRVLVMKKDEKTNGSRRDYLFSCSFACRQWLGLDPCSFSFPPNFAFFFIQTKKKATTYGKGVWVESEAQNVIILRLKCCSKWGSKMFL